MQREPMGGGHVSSNAEGNEDDTLVSIPAGAYRRMIRRLHHLDRRLGIGAREIREVLELLSQLVPEGKATAGD